MKEVMFHIKGVPVHVWRPKNPEHGDLSTDCAFVLAKVYGGTPMEWAEKIVKAIK